MATTEELRTINCIYVQISHLSGTVSSHYWHTTLKLHTNPREFLCSGQSKPFVRTGDEMWAICPGKFQQYVC